LLYRLLKRPAPQTPSAGQLTRIHAISTCEHREAQVCDEEEPPTPTGTTWWTVDRCYQAALDQVRHVRRESRAASPYPQRQQVRNGGQWQVSDQIQRNRLDRREPGGFLYGHAPGGVGHWTIYPAPSLRFSCSSAAEDPALSTSNPNVC
jgi:hypothetical protein